MLSRSGPQLLQDFDEIRVAKLPQFAGRLNIL